MIEPQEEAGYGAKGQSWGVTLHLDSDPDMNNRHQ
jgi:hypothetical protein